MPDTSTDIEQLLTDLVDYAMDRAETRFLLRHWPQGHNVPPVQLEYELQILKIITVGWSLSYYLDGNPAGRRLQDSFWHSVRRLAAEVSSTTQMITGQEIDYFNVLKERLDRYVTAMTGRSGQTIEPAQVVGTVFAELCNDRQDLFTRTAGGKMFNNTLLRIRQYLEATRWI